MNLGICLTQGLANQLSALFCTLWVGRVLWFLPWDQASLPAAQPVAAQLAALRQHTCLQPSSR